MVWLIWTQYESGTSNIVSWRVLMSLRCLGRGEQTKTYSLTTVTYNNTFQPESALGKTIPNSRNDYSPNTTKQLFKCLFATMLYNSKLRYIYSQVYIYIYIIVCGHRFFSMDINVIRIHYKGVLNSMGMEPFTFWWLPEAYCEDEKSHLGLHTNRA